MEAICAMRSCRGEEDGSGGIVQGWAYISVGTDGFAPGRAGHGTSSRPMSDACSRYSSDSARTFSLGVRRPLRMRFTRLFTQLLRPGSPTEDR
jgi:hypothetical protein